MLSTEKRIYLRDSITKSLEDFEVLADKAQSEASTRREHSNIYLVIAKAIDVMRNLVNLNEAQEEDIKNLIEAQEAAKEEEVDPITEVALGNIVCIKFKTSTCCDDSNTPFVALVESFENSAKKSYFIVNGVTIDKQDVESFEIYIKS